MDLMRSVLSEVQNGKRAFQPVAETPAAVFQFQSIAKRLQSAHKQGFITDLKVQVSHGRETHGSIINAIVVGGLTFEGEQFLDAAHKAEPSQQQPIVQLKPALWGISIDLIALYEWLKRKVKRGR